MTTPKPRVRTMDEITTDIKQDFKELERDIIKENERLTQELTVKAKEVRVSQELLQLYVNINIVNKLTKTREDLMHKKYYLKTLLANDEAITIKCKTC